MKEIFETWLGVFFLTLLMVTGISIISAGIDARNADAAKTGYIAQIENSNFSASVIQDVLAQSDAEGYDVTLDLYHSGSPVTADVTTADAVGDTSDVYMVRLELAFDYKVSILSIVAENSLVGYAR